MDARFEDVAGGDRPIRLRAETTGDLEVLSSLVQDAVTTAAEISYARGRRRLFVLMNRFRWEDRETALAEGRPPERVRAMLSVGLVGAVRARGLDPADKSQVLSILALGFERTGDAEDPSGRLVIALAGDGDLAADVEALEVTLEDVTRPWAAPSGKSPDHGL